MHSAAADASAAPAEMRSSADVSTTADMAAATAEMAAAADVAPATSAASSRGCVGSANQDHGQDGNGTDFWL
jgi:hypothetical protein